MGVCARVAGRPVKWVEDRLEHLMAATSATARRTDLEAAVSGDGRVTGPADGADRGCRSLSAGARAGHPLPEHGNLTGAYADSGTLDVVNRSC